MNKKLSDIISNIDIENHIATKEDIDNTYQNVLSKIDTEAFTKSKRILFYAKRAIAVVAAFAVVVTAGALGTKHFQSEKIIQPTNSSVQSTTKANVIPLDFSIIAYAGENNEASAKELSDCNLTLADCRVALKKDNNGYYVEFSSDNNCFSIKSDSDIDCAEFESKLGTLEYFDFPRQQALINKNEFYSAVVPLTKAEAREYNEYITKNGESTYGCRRFLEKIMKSRDCSEYISKDIDLDKYIVEFSEDYKENCFRLKEIKMLKSLTSKGNKITAKTYSNDDEIRLVSYFPNYVEHYLIDNPKMPYDELPSDMIIITVKFKNGQSITKKVVTEFDKNGMLNFKIDK